MDFADYYQKRCEVATKEQGIDVLVKALEENGVKASAQQTGGFTMCAYVEIDSKNYIYANLYGAGIYDQEGFVKDLIQFDTEQGAEVIAEAVANYAKKGWA